MRILILCLIIWPFYVTAQEKSVSGILQKGIDHSGKHKVHSILFYLENRRENKLFHEGLGLTQQKGEKVSPHAQFKIASITKPFIASIVLQLEEEAKLKLEDKIFPYLNKLPFLKMEEFHFYEDQAYGKEISIEQLLSHRTGLADIFNEKGSRFYLGVFLNKAKQYSPRAIVDKYHQYKLNRSAHFKPGQGFFYSDMNYVLLGLLIEEIEKRPLAEVIRDRILDPLKMEKTYFEYYEEAREGPQMVHQYINRIDMTRINTSFDWAGGGLVSTTEDLATFFKALFDGKIISKNSLEKMTHMKATQSQNYRYGFGLYETRYGGDIFYGHYGFYGSFLGYCPEKEIVVSYNISQSNPAFNFREILEQILEIYQ